MIAIVRYSHRHGTDVIPCRIPVGQDLPEITNAFLQEIGVDEPELERWDEYAEWVGPMSIDELPMVGDPAPA